MDIFVDRSNELADITSLVYDKDNTNRMALLRADARMGKSALLDKIRADQSFKSVVALVDLKSELCGPFEFVRNLAKKLISQGIKLPSYHVMDSELGGDQAPINFSMNRVRSKQSPVNITRSIDNEDENRRRADQLLEALLDDIASTPAPPRCLILIDDYHDAGPSLSGWFEMSALQTILYKDAARFVIVDGSKLSIPRDASERGYVLGLKKLEVEHIVQWLTEIGWRTEYDGDRPIPVTAQFIWRGTRGVPGDVGPFIFNHMGGNDT